MYSAEQVADWFAPITADDVRGVKVLEMGCGNGSLMVHVLRWAPAMLEGVDLGASVVSARANLEAGGRGNWVVRQADLTTYGAGGFDVVYSIGVLHQLKAPNLGFDAVVRNVRAGASTAGCTRGKATP